MEFIPLYQVTSQNIETRIGELAAALAADEARAQRFGVILRDVEPIDPVAFIKAALKHRRDEKLSLRIAIPDHDLRKAVPRVRNELKEAEAELLTDSEEVTVDWRNKHLRTIIVLANKPLTKGSSLRDFSIRDDRDLLAFLVRQKAEDAATAFLRNFWKALIDRKAPDNFRLADVVGLVLELEALPSDNERSLYLKNFLSLDVSGEKLTPKKLEEELLANPAHLTVVFDPFEVRRGMFRREGSFSLNPWVLSYRYEYDRIQKKVTQIPIADANVFGSYLQLVGVVEPRLRNQTVAHAANADESAGHSPRLPARRPTAVAKAVFLFRRDVHQHEVGMA